MNYKEFKKAVPNKMDRRRIRAEKGLWYITHRDDLVPAEELEGEEYERAKKSYHKTFRKDIAAGIEKRKNNKDKHSKEIVLILTAYIEKLDEIFQYAE